VPEFGFGIEGFAFGFQVSGFGFRVSDLPPAVVPREGVTARTVGVLEATASKGAIKTLNGAVSLKRGEMCTLVSRAASGYPNT